MGLTNSHQGSKTFGAEPRTWKPTPQSPSPGAETQNSNVIAQGHLYVVYLRPEGALKGKSLLGNSHTLSSSSWNQGPNPQWLSSSRTQACALDHSNTTATINISLRLTVYYMIATQSPKSNPASLSARCMNSSLAFFSGLVSSVFQVMLVTLMYVRRCRPSYRLG